MVKKINTSLKRTIRQYSLYYQLSSNMFRPKLGQLQALKIQNTLRKTFNGQGTIGLLPRQLLDYYHDNSGFSGR